MFSVYCKHCGATLLLGPANILAVQNTSAGIVVRFRCYHGHEGLWRNADDQSRRPLVRTGGHGAGGEVSGVPTTTGLANTTPGGPNVQAGGRGGRPDRPGFQVAGPNTRPGHRNAEAAGRTVRRGNHTAPGDRAGSSGPAAPDLSDLDDIRSGGNAWRPQWARWSRVPWRRPRQACAGTARRRRPQSGS
jgi:hypothetical protein